MDLKAKVALFCDVDREAVIELIDACSIYQFLDFSQEGLDLQVKNRLDLHCGELDLAEWVTMVDKILHMNKQVVIGLVGKYGTAGCLSERSGIA